MSDKTPAYLKVMEMSDDLRAMSYQRKVIVETYQYDQLVRNDSGQTTVTVKDAQWASMSQIGVERLSLATLGYMIREVFQKLNYCNLLVYLNRAKSQSRLAIKELVDQGILFETEVKSFYLINPVRVWKGNPITSTELTKELLREHRKPSIELLHDLRPRTVKLPNIKSAFELLSDAP